MVISKPSNGQLAKIIFSGHLLAVAILITFLALRAFLEAPGFRPTHWCIPLITSTVVSAIAALSWLLLSLHHPSMALKASLWLSPLFTCATGILLLATGTGLGLAVATFTLATALSLALYSCSTISQLKRTHQILTDSITAVPLSIKVARFVTFGLITGVIYAWFWSLGAGGVLSKGSPFAGIYILVLFLSLAWTMNVIRNTMHVAISRIAYMHLMHGLDMDVSQAFTEAATKSLSSICLGSAMAPAIGAFRGMARAMAAIAGGSDEFLFSCATCYTGLADQLLPSGNWWAFVHVGVHSKGFVQASRDVWELFVKQKMVPVIDRDFTAVFCFLSGIAGGTLSAMVGGSWMLVVEKRYVTGGAACAFLVGYFMVRIGTAWAQACVLAYHVAYAENPMNQRLGLAMSEWLKELESSPV
ncbi:hypothetical protein J5N97_027516 [Dioscorea zingiberensis]|uniref:Choline transporter-like protein n=1 Tax=Dioscorea zingiberensis TaxID=325984 RepID=A0A9D5H7R6_9LILI|nr:hypothetical protein J5N97_027516 [Dioscorea zingiberensis]